MFEPLPARFDFPKAEQQVLEFWERHNVFQRSLELRRDAPRFVFYEGPPTANGAPHPGHCLTRAIKDLFPRYRTMCGHLVERKAGWDTHGLPVEIEVCNELGIHSKEEIEQYGLDRFVQRCIQSVFRYVKEWEEMTRRLGFWVNLEDAYITYHQSYVESIWWSLKTLFDRGLLYQGHKVVWWWAQGGTALSAGEVGEGYRTVEDPAVYIRFPLVRDKALAEQLQYFGVTTDDPVSLLVWTTTPWTLISNHFAAVHPEFRYALVYDPQEREYLFIAENLVDAIQQKVKRELRVLQNKCQGGALLGLRYVPPFPESYYERATDPNRYAYPTYSGEIVNPPGTRLGDVRALVRGQPDQFEHIGWRVVEADFVTLDTGTGIVHEAPAYGEVDFDLLQEGRRRFADPDAIPLLNAVAPNGTFNDEAPEQYRGRWVKDCDEEIMREMAERGILYHRETIEHEYPFCPRSEDDPLIQYARKSWFVRTSQFRDEFLKNNDGIYWLPDHIKEGRFGDFLRNNVDWALSRERYWGTPLPIWVCEKTGKMEAIGSYAELLAKPDVQGTEFWEQAKKENPDLPDHLRVHKPYIDAITYASRFVDVAQPPSAGSSDAAQSPSAVRPQPEAAGLHKPRMRRVPEVIDCWWDAGSMPFAQWGFPHVEGSVQTFAERFPCDFISEAIDQTRGWFYGLLAISTLLFGERRDEVHMPAPAPPKPDSGHPYKTCIVLGHVMGEDGLKMSKRAKNYREPDYIFDHYGADAMRWYFFSAQTPWTSVRFLEANIRDAQREFLVRLYNVFSFFNIYANIDRFDPGNSHEATKPRSHEACEEPRASARAVALTESGAAREEPRGLKSTPRATGWRPVQERSELDRWISSELHRTIRFVRERMDRFENYPAAGRLNDFVDALSNWYVRRSRDRFWRAVTGSVGVSPADQDKWDAYNTLYEMLVTVSKLTAPFTPFVAETMYQNLVTRDEGTKGQRDEGATSRPVSVHLCDYPQADESLINEPLGEEMDLVRQIVSLGRAARTTAKLKVRQPLAEAEIILAKREHTAWLEAHSDLIADELNIKRVGFTSEADHYVTYQIKPEFKAIGPKFGKLAPKIAAALEKLDAAEARKTLSSTGELWVEAEGQRVHLTGHDVHVRLEARPGWAAAQGRAGVVVIKTELTLELRQEGLVRELIHHVQGLRKQQDLAYEARITLYVAGPEEFLAVVRRFGDTVKHECLAEQLDLAAPPSGEVCQKKIEGHTVTLAVVPR